MPIGFFVSHPEVVVDPLTAVPCWRLSDHGRTRMQLFARSSRVAGVTAIWSSTETKAVEAAGLLGDVLGLPVAIDTDLHENDRSATGFLPPAEFNAAADAFFARPQESFRGWETAAAAQARIAQAVDRIVAAHLERNGALGQGDLAIVSHGGVGTLLQCLYAGVPITRARDQPFQGHVWAFDLARRAVLHGWEPLPLP